MFCGKCGSPIDPNRIYCGKCGNCLNNNQQIPNDLSSNSFNNNSTNNIKKPINKFFFIGSGIMVAILIAFIIFNNTGNYYFSDDAYGNNEEINSSTNTKSDTTKKGKYKTAIIYDNRYSGVKIVDDDDAYKLIEKDSISQKDKCPTEIRKIEDGIIEKYGITAVNLCEMDIDFAKEIDNVFKLIYEEYPMARGYITNLTLVNTTMSEGYIAAFQPTFPFVDDSYPMVFKTQILLNTSYFLNPKRLESSVQNASSTGHFPPNATIYSPVAHELGHYLSFIASMKHYNEDSILLVNEKDENVFYKIYADFVDGGFSLQMIKEAFEKYKKDTNTQLTLNEWRGTISAYALAKDNNGDYIYDETIAEAFHDVYLNRDNAKDASKYIVSVLKEHLEG